LKRQEAIRFYERDGETARKIVPVFPYFGMGVLWGRLLGQP
jgi:hypothetical protein